MKTLSYHLLRNSALKRKDRIDAAVEILAAPVIPGSANTLQARIQARVLLKNYGMKRPYDNVVVEKIKPFLWKVIQP